MADDKNHDQDPEEDKFDDDEDFGLPDLEYDELDEDDSSGEEFDAEFDEEFSDEDLDLEEDLNLDDLDDDLDDDFADSELSEESDDDSSEEGTPASADDSTEETEDDFSGGDDDLDLDDLDVDDLDVDDLDLDDSDDFDMSEEELQAELDKMDDDGGDEAEEEASSEDESEFYDEETYDDFDPSDLAGDEETFAAAESSSVPNYPAGGYQKQEIKEEKGKFGKIVIFGTILFIVIAAVLYLVWDGDTGEDKVAEKTENVKEPTAAEKAAAEKAAAEKAAAEKAAAEKAAAERAAAEKAQQAKDKNKANTAPAGTVTTLSGRNGKSYIVVGSFLDGDLANDYAQKLAGNGMSPYVVPPFADYRFYRVAIAEFDTYAAATQNVDSYRDQYGQDIWTLRY